MDSATTTAMNNAAQEESRLERLEMDDNASFHACPGKQEEEDDLRHIVEEQPHAQADDQEEQQEESRVFQYLMRHKGSACLLSSCPRLLAWIFGVVVPLFVLIFISIIFGKILSVMEAEGEVQLNDGLLAAQKEALVYSSVVVNTSLVLPVKCLQLYMKNESFTRIGAEIEEWLWEYSNRSEIESFFEDNTTYAITNLDEMNKYMLLCGEHARSISAALFEEAQDATERAMDDLTFNWIRCHPNSKKDYRVGNGDFFTPPRPEFRPEYQEAYYISTWEADQQYLYGLYYDENIESGMNNTQADKQALNASIADATGGTGCDANGPAAAWWWFTVMTTVGYGNQSPVSDGGRLMTFTLGFVSILCFGAILATAGNILSLIFDDAARRLHLDLLTRPWVASCIWGTAYYAWMVLIAGLTERWKSRRLGDDAFTMGEGYWFAYISTTTVGLGDIYLEPEVLVGYDLIVFPLAFLTGFTFLSAFLGKFSEAILSILKGERKGIVESLMGLLDKASPADTSAETEAATAVETKATKETEEQQLADTSMDKPTPDINKTREQAEEVMAT